MHLCIIITKYTQYAVKYSIAAKVLGYSKVHSETYSIHSFKSIN